MALIYATCFSKSDDQTTKRTPRKSCFLNYPNITRLATLIYIEFYIIFYPPQCVDSSYFSYWSSNFLSSTMRRLVIFQLLVLKFSLLIGCKALPPGLILTSRHYPETSLGHHTLVKRANGQDLWDNLQIKLACGAEDDVKETQDDISKSEKFKLYAPFTKPFQKTPDTQQIVGWDIRNAIRFLSDSGDTDTLFTFRETTSAKDPSANNICFQQNFLVSKGIVIAENNDRERDMVPKANQLSWSDIVFYTYNGDVSKHEIPLSALYH